MSSKIGGMAQELERTISAVYESIQITVLIMGPSPSAVSGDDVASRLRTELATRCSAFGTSVLPEHPALRDVAKLLGSDHDLCTYEHHLVKQCELLILLPASAGSFCELGYFGMVDDACAKMLILFDRDKPQSGSYVADGPVRAAQNRRALVRYVDYNDTESVWSVVKGQIDTVRGRRSIHSQR